MMVTDVHKDAAEKKNIPRVSSLIIAIKSSIRSERSTNFLIDHLIPLSLFFMLSIFIFRNIIGVKGVIIEGDFAYPPKLEGFFRFYYPMWDDYTSISAIARLPRLLFYMPFFAIGFLFDMDTTEMMVMVFIFCEFLAGISMYYASGYILKRSYNDNERLITIASIIAGLAYMWSYFIIFNFKYPHHRAAYALAPFMILTLIVGLENKKPRYIVITGFLWCVACMDMHWTVLGAILFFSIIIYYFLIDVIKLPDNGKLRTLKRALIYHLKSLVILVGSYICFSGYWLLPGYQMGGTSRYPPIIYAESHELFYSQSTMTNIMGKQASYFQPRVAFDPSVDFLSSSIMQNSVIALGLVFFIFGMTVLIMKPKNRYVVFFALFALIAIFLSAIAQFSSELWFWLVHRAPLHGLYGWVFKWSIISEFVILSLCFLSGFSIVEILTRIQESKLKSINLKKGVATLLICILLLSILLPKWPLATGDMNGWLMPSEMPDEFEQVNSWLEKQEGDFKVLWVPKYHGYDVDWYRGNKIYKDIAGLSSSKPTYVFWDALKQPNGYGIYFLSSTISYLLYPDSMLINNATNNLGKVLAPLGIKYIIFHDDNAIDKDQSDALLNNLEHQYDLERVKTYGFIYVYENKYYDEQDNSHFFTTSGDHLVYGGLASLVTLNSIPEFHSRDDGLIFGNQKQYDFRELNEIVDDVIFTKSRGLEEVALTFADEKYFIAPFDYTEHYAPEERWSKIGLNTIGNIKAHEKGNNMEEWDWDYSRGLVITWSPGSLNVDASVREEDLIKYYDFETGLNDFTPVTTNLTTSLSNNSAIGGSSLMGFIPKGDPTQNQIASTNYMSLPNRGGYYRFSMYFAAENMNNVQVRIKYYDVKDEFIGWHSLLKETGNFGFQTIEEDVLSPLDARYCTVQIVAEQNPTTEGFWWVDDIRIYDLKNNTGYNMLEMDFEADKTDDYDIFIRCLKSEVGGEIGIYLDGELIESLDTISKPNAFGWEEVVSTTLKRGTHTLAIDNVAGFNAVNLMTIIPAIKMEEYFNSGEEFLKEKGLIYTFEAESDFYYENASVSNVHGNAASWAEVLRLRDNGMAWLPVDIVRDDRYSISIRLIGESGHNKLNVSFGGNSRDLDYNGGSNFLWLNMTDMHLDKGTHELEFSASRCEEILSNPSFEEGWNSTTQAPEYWDTRNPQFSALDSSNTTDGEYSFKLTTNATELTFQTWVWTQSNDIPVIPNREYEVSIDIKTENVKSTPVKIFGYNTTSGIGEIITSIAAGMNGSKDWNNYRRSFFVPEDISNISVVLYSGTVSNSTLGNATTWFDNFKLYSDRKDNNNEIDLVVIHAKDNNSTLQDIFKPSRVATVLNYEKIDATKYKVKVTSTEPFILAFAEAYDELWAAHIGGETVEGIPLYGMLNGYFINKTGNFTITIEYGPQQWFNIGMGITGISTLGSFGYFLWIDRRSWGAKLKNLFKKLAKLTKIIGWKK